MASDEHTTHVTRVVTRDGGEVRLVRGYTLEVLEGAAPARRSVEAPLFRVGSHASNDLVLTDDAVSKHHLEIEVTPEGYRITDLSSRNGTFLEPTSAAEERVRLGQATVLSPVRLRLGRTTLLFAPGTREVEVPGSRELRFGPLVGRSAPMRELFARLRALAPTDASVLLEGETGTGKELVAESLHAASSRVAGPFVVVDCAAIAGEVFESELFGHVKGAFTGASTSRRGLFAEADGGTLFLDELGELPLDKQAKLLGALERGRFTPVGSDRPVSFDARVIGATNRDLARETNEGRFRADLFYRIAVFRLRIPPLRERREDIPLLCAEILDALRAQAGGSPAIPEQLSAVTLASLQGRSWPGNVRELRNAVERALHRLDPASSTGGAEGERYALARDRAIEAFERAFLADLLARTGGNVSEAARRAGLDRRNLQRLLRRHQR